MSLRGKIKGLVDDVATGSRHYTEDVTDAILAAVMEALPREREFTSTSAVFTDTPDGCAGFNLAITEIKSRLSWKGAQE